MMCLPQAGALRAGAQRRIMDDARSEMPWLFRMRRAVVEPPVNQERMAQILGCRQVVFLRLTFAFTPHFGLS
jgi:hypothetical protein